MRARAKSVLYKSTRGGESGLSFEKVLLSAYAQDGGLYVPEYLPLFTKEELKLWSGFTFPQVAAQVLEVFTGLTLSECQKMTEAAFSEEAGWNGGSDSPLPLKEVGGRTFLETGEGPTLAFKDIGQQVVAQLLNYYLGRRGAVANIMVETSGDTGPAAVAGVKGCPNVEIFCLYPHERVSEVQELQLITVQEPNVHVYRTEGNTDEQAEVLKQIFTDEPEFMGKYNVCSINSINWARIAAQSSYYVWACLQVCPKLDRPVNFCVPTGAFGNSMGGFLAKKMGAPIGKIVCATNANDIVHRMISVGDMRPGANVETLSPAMDIQFAYNLERMLYYLVNENPEVLSGIMLGLERSGGFTQESTDRTTKAMQLDPLVMDRVRGLFLSCSVGDGDTLATMARVWREDRYCLCPHSAIAVHAADTLPEVQAMRERGEPVVCVLTAHPAKFETAVQQAIGQAPPTTPTVEALRKMPHKFDVLPKDKDDTTAQFQSAWKKTLMAAVETTAAARSTGTSRL